MAWHSGSEWEKTQELWHTKEPFPTSCRERNWVWREALRFQSHDTSDGPQTVVSSYAPSHIHVIHPLLSSRNANIWRNFFMSHFLISSPLISRGCYAVALMTLDSRVHRLRFHQHHIKNSHSALRSSLMPKHGKMTFSRSMFMIRRRGSPTWVPKSDKEAPSPNCGKAWYRQLCRPPMSGSCPLTALLVAWPSAALVSCKCAREQKVLHTGRHLINKMTKVAFILS